jgi:hypothetical protein
VNSQTLLLPQFNAALFGGDTPSAMTLSFVGDLVVNPNDVDGQGVEFINKSSAHSSAVTLHGAWTFTISADGLDPDFSFSQGWNPGPVAVGSGSPSNPYVATFAAAGTQIALDGGPSAYVPVPASFLGAGMVSLDVSDEMIMDNFTGINSSNAQMVWDFAAQGTLSVTYEVPAPAPLALLGLGFAGLAGIARRRRQCT